VGLWITVVQDASRPREADEPVAEGLCGGNVRCRRGLRVDGQCEASIRVSEPRLGRLEVHVFQDHAGGVGAAKVVELEPVEAGLDGRRVPDAASEVGVVEEATVRGGEDQGVDVGTRQLPPGHQQPEPVPDSAGSDFGAAWKRPTSGVAT